MISREEIEKLKNVSKDDVNFNDLVELKDIKDIDLFIPLEERLQVLLDIMKNPYIFKSNNSKVIISHTKNGITLDEAIIKHFIDKI